MRTRVRFAMGKTHVPIPREQFATGFLPRTGQKNRLRTALTLMASFTSVLAIPPRTGTTVVNGFTACWVVHIRVCHPTEDRNDGCERFHRLLGRSHPGLPSRIGWLVTRSDSNSRLARRRERPCLATPPFPAIPVAAARPPASPTCPKLGIFALKGWCCSVSAGWGLDTAPS